MITAILIIRVSASLPVPLRLAVGSWNLLQGRFVIRFVIQMRASAEMDALIQAERMEYARLAAAVENRGGELPPEEIRRMPAGDQHQLTQQEDEMVPLRHLR